MTPTTLRTVAADFAAQIRQISPDYPLLTGETWTPVERPDLVPGGRLRAFCCEWEPGEPQEDGIYGSAVEWVSQLYVWTNYRNLPTADGETQDVASEMITADGRQIWLTLEARCDPTVSGVLYVDHAGWTPEESEPGHEWGYHEYQVRYLVSHSL